ncbi:hypothetical protein ABZP36_005137 [Zizania latifolia]
MGAQQSVNEILSLEALYKVVSGAMRHISDSIMTTLLNDGVKRFTVNAVLGIDIDLKLLEAFADEKFHSTGLSNLGKETTFSYCLVEIRQLVNLLLSSHLENLMNLVIRMKTCGSLDYKKVALSFVTSTRTSQMGCLEAFPTATRSRMLARGPWMF